MNEFIVKKQVTINADPSAVWDGLTNAVKTKKYFFNCEVFSDWKVGSSITFKGTMFLVKKIEMSGHILEIEPERLLKYNLVNADGNTHSISTVTEELTYENGATTLVVTDDVGKGEGAEDRHEKSMKGWDKVLKGLKKVVEAEKEG